MSNEAIRDLLLKRGDELFRSPRQIRHFTNNTNADVLLNDLDNYPHAFVLACVGSTNQGGTGMAYPVSNLGKNWWVRILSAPFSYTSGRAGTYDEAGPSASLLRRND